MHRTVIIAAAACLAGPAAAQVCTTHITVVSRGDQVVGATVASTSCEPAPASADQSFTQTTTLVRRGATVVGASSAIKCDASKAASRDDAATPKAANPPAAGQASLVRKVLTAGANKGATITNVRGYWRVADEYSTRICRLFLTQQTDPAGFRARPTDCPGELARIAAWTFDDGAVTFRATGGEVVARLDGSRERLQGKSAAGAAVLLVR